MNNATYPISHAPSYFNLSCWHVVSGQMVGFPTKVSDMVSLYVLTVTDTIISTRRHEILSRNTVQYNQILDERGNVKLSVWQYK